MLRNKQQFRKDPLMRDGKVPVLIALIDGLELDAFFHDPSCRRRLNEVLDTFSDEEFDRFERLYTNRFPTN